MVLHFLHKFCLIDFSSHLQHFFKKIFSLCLSNFQTLTLFLVRGIQQTNNGVSINYANA